MGVNFSIFTALRFVLEDGRMSFVQRTPLFTVVANTCLVFLRLMRATMAAEALELFSGHDAVRFV